LDLLRFITAGSVDDGKSTLIGRLLYDSKAVMTDHLAAIKKQTKNKVSGEIDLALLTDGLRAEREQGITIDVAYKYFATPVRKFIIADAPGHIQYTRNMITGASTADLVIVLVDARNGVTEQTKRHSIIASLLNIQHVVVAVNKMDLVNHSEETYNQIVDDYASFSNSLGLPSVHYIPISAISGDNIVEKSENFKWYRGPSLLNFLETVEVTLCDSTSEVRFPVQYVIRPQTAALHDYRGYAGKLVTGSLSKGDEVKILPAGLTSVISTVEISGNEVESATAPQAIVVQLEDDIDVSRGDTIVKLGNEPSVLNEFDAMLCWMDTEQLVTGNSYLFQIHGKRIRAIVKSIQYKLNINTLEEEKIQGGVGLNEIVRATIKTSSPVVFDAFEKFPAAGCAILIDETSNLTVGACMLM